MKKFQGVWLPDGERHLPEWMSRAGEIVDGKGSYQIKKLRKALSYCSQFRTAIDVGGHCGLWSMQLVKRFETVHAFEPVPLHRECFKMNCPSAILHDCALGAVNDLVSITSPAHNSGNSYISGKGKIRMVRFDDYTKINTVDFMKLDCEGYELFALQGAITMIDHCRPVIIVEQKPGRAQRFGLGETEAVTFLQDNGYALAAKMSGDFIMVPSDAHLHRA